MINQEKIKNRVNALYNLRKKNEVFAFALGFLFGPSGGLYVSFRFFFTLLFCQLVLWAAVAILLKSGFGMGWSYLGLSMVNGIATAMATANSNEVLLAEIKLSHLQDIDE